MSGIWTTFASHLSDVNEPQRYEAMLEMTLTSQPFKIGRITMKLFSDHDQDKSHEPQNRPI